jgi:hypothetical protein
MHISTKRDHVNGAKTAPVGIKEVDDCEGRHLRVEGVSILEVIVPNLIDRLAKELGGPTLGRIGAGIDVKAGFVGQLCVDTDYHGGIVGGDVVIERETNGAFERLATMVGGISCGLLVEDGCEGMDAPELVVGDLHQDGEQYLLD